MTELTKHKLSDLYTLASGISSSKDQAGHGQPFLTFSTAFNNVFLPDTLPDLMASNEKEQEKHSIKSGDVFLTRTSEVVDELAISSVAVKDYPSATFSGFLKRLRPKESGKAHPNYMALYLRSQLFRKAMDNNAVMTLRASFNEAIFSYLNVWLPEYDKQVEIGDLLYAIEKKIAINSKINAELEAMAKLIYDYWFVQFDFPDTDGKPYKSSGGRMVYSEALKRELPAGWADGALGDLFDMYQPKTISDKDMDPNGKYFVYGSNGIIGKFHEFNHEESMVTISCRGDCGNINITSPRSYITGNAMVIAPKSSDLCIDYISNLLRNSNVYSAITGSVQKQITRGNLSPVKICKPDERVIREYMKLTSCNFRRRELALQETRELANLRDWLLPMLMNGQVTVGE